MALIEGKRCSKCGKHKLVTEFYRDREGYSSRCKACIAVRAKKFYEDNARKIRAKMRAYTRLAQEYPDEFEEIWNEEMRRD